MSNKLHIGLIDSGCDDITCDGGFIDVENSSYQVTKLKKDLHNHGTEISNIIGNEHASFTCAQVFDKELITTAETISFAIDYLCKKGVDLIHMSLGLKNDRKILKEAIQKAIDKNITIVASSASLSTNKTYPASYIGVIAVTADARCFEDNISYINCEHATLGASPFSNNPQIRGSSSAAAHVTRLLSKLHFDGIVEVNEQLEYIKSNALYKTAQARLSKGVNSCNQ